jgi:hypothetical protein
MLSPRRSISILLDKLEGSPPRNLEYGAAQRQQVLAQGPAHHIIDRIVPAYVFPKTKQLRAWAIRRPGRHSRLVCRASTNMPGLDVVLAPASAT